jgi:hypothetical protein
MCARLDARALRSKPKPKRKPKPQAREERMDEGNNPNTHSPVLRCVALRVAHYARACV